MIKRTKKQFKPRKKSELYKWLPPPTKREVTKKEPFSLTNKLFAKVLSEVYINSAFFYLGKF